MKFSIFSRLFISYLFIFLMFVALSTFFISHFNEVGDIIHSIILKDNRKIEDSKKLSELLMAEDRYNSDYINELNEDLREQYLFAKKAFTNLLFTAQQNASKPDTALLTKIESSHDRFTHLVEEEKQSFKAGKGDKTAFYDAEKARLTADMINGLSHFQQARKKEVLLKIKELQEETREASNVAVTITVSALLIGLIIALWITRGITKPIDRMKKKTVQIAKGNFDGDLDINSPPSLHELAQAINTMCRKLQEVDSIKSDFFANMSHELRTPLSSIKEGTSLLMEGHGGTISNQQQQILTIISKESKRLIHLVNTILDLSKMEAGMLEYTFAPADLVSLMEQTVSALMPMAEKKAITITNTLADLPMVNADQERISQVFRNLLSNALKFTPRHGNITLAGAIKNDHLEITVQDSGVGIPTSDLDTIFQKFQQGTPSLGGNAKGTGLGLAIVHQVVLAHSGKVWATSQNGMGSTFHLLLPVSS